MNIMLSQILALVGKLDDTPGDETPRERFRHYLRENVNEIGQIRDYIGECLRASGDQYNCALQDLVNHLGQFLGFEVTFGRYRGVQGQLGFDGHWKSPAAFHIVVEVKTTETYAIKTSTLLNYVNDLISEKRIPSWETALGLYVIGRPDPDLRQLENAIVAEKQTHQLRIISVESLLSLAEMMSEYDIRHEDILAVLRPSRPTIDPVVNLMVRLVSPPVEPVVVPPVEPTEGEAAYWLTPVRSDEEQTAEDCIQTLVARERIYAFGERTPGRKHIKPGDWMCFYACGKGVVAHAKVLTEPVKQPHSKVHHPEDYPWVFKVGEAQVYLDAPIAIDAALRSQLDAFRDRDLNKAWAWFVQATRSISEHDFKILTRG